MVRGISVVKWPCDKVALLLEDPSESAELPIVGLDKI
jgi:hypothetical protein